MATQIQWRKGTTAQHTSFTGVLAEVTVDTDKKTAVIHDGATAGGFPLAKESQLTAANISNTPAGSIAATTVQAALNELDTEKQPLDATLTAIAALSTGADKLAYSTGTDTFSETAFTPFARTVLDDADAVTARATLLVQYRSNIVARSNGIAADKTEYLDSGASYAAIGDAEFAVSVPGTLKNMYANSSGAPGAGQSFAYTLFKNGVAQTLTCTISDPDTAASDTTNTVTVASGDKIAIRCVTSVTAATKLHHVMCELVSI